MIPVDEQIRAWRRANKKMNWEIGEKEFQGIGSPPLLTDGGPDQGFAGAAIFYGFGDDGTGHADAVLSGKTAWDYACRHLNT